MTGLLATGAATGFASALMPLVSIELYLSMVAGHLGLGHAVVLSLLAAAGQTTGKLVWYTAGHRGAESRWMQKLQAKPKFGASYQTWVARVEGRPIYTTGAVTLGALTGLPPLLVMSVVAGTVRMRLPVFITACVIGRFGRFMAILLGMASILN